MRLDKYPYEFYQAFKKALHEEVRIPFPSSDEAKAFRAKLYTFRRALQQRPEKDPKLSLTCSAVSISIDGTAVVMKPSTDPRLLQRINSSI